MDAEADSHLAPVSIFSFVAVLSLFFNFFFPVSSILDTDTEKAIRR
jgi:hypothetical protein